MDSKTSLVLSSCSITRAGSRRSLNLSLLLALTACGGTTPSPEPLMPTAAARATSELAQSLASGLAAACPLAAPDDRVAHARCADALAELPLLRELMVEPFDWGGQIAEGEYTFEKSHRTDLNPRIWRRLYLPTFMFTGAHSEFGFGSTEIIRLAVHFRNGIDPGDFPYPFWHAPAKWESYQTARELLFFVRKGKLVGALRSFEKDPARPRREMKWDGRWVWEDADGIQPRVTLFSNAFSPGNPNVLPLDQAYRALEKELRAEACMTCHSPDNGGKMNPLELISYPNQALSSRREIVKVIEGDTMPPTIGIPDPKRRAELLALAKAFAVAADRALAFDREMPPAAP